MPLGMVKKEVLFVSRRESPESLRRHCAGITRLAQPLFGFSQFQFRDERRVRGMFVDPARELFFKSVLTK